MLGWGSFTQRSVHFQLVWIELVWVQTVVREVRLLFVVVLMAMVSNYSHWFGLGRRPIEPIGEHGKVREMGGVALGQSFCRSVWIMVHFGMRSRRGDNDKVRICCLGPILLQMRDVGSHLECSVTF